MYVWHIIKQNAMPLFPDLCQYRFSAECGWCTPIVAAWAPVWSRNSYHNCSTCKFNNHLCHPTSSECCFKNIITGHLFDQFKKRLWICMAKCRLAEKLHPIARWSYWKDQGQPAEEYQTQTTPWRPLRFSDERLYIKIKCCYYLGKVKRMHFLSASKIQK